MTFGLPEYPPESKPEARNIFSNDPQMKARQSHLPTCHRSGYSGNRTVDRC
ncbi:MAG: hypothetical protein R3C26_10995 [Calditrichia bacterium]